MIIYLILSILLFSIQGAYIYPLITIVIGWSPNTIYSLKNSASEQLP